MLQSMASGSTSQQISPSVNQTIVIVNKKLVELISTVHKMGVVTTVGEVLQGLRFYISSKKLFDPQNVRRICCSKDELSSVLGVEEFTISDVGKILQKQCVPVILKNNSNQDVQVGPSSFNENAGKRKAEDESEGRILKKTCDLPHEPMFLYVPPSPRKEDSSSESVESCQGYETAIVKDSSDLSFSSDSDKDLVPGDILAVEETFDVEYEVQSGSDQENDVYLSDSGSDLEDACDTVLTFVCKSDSDEEFWADKSSDDNYDSDTEIILSDMWQCKCGKYNNPFMSLCDECRCTRSGWFQPSRSEPRLHPRRKQKPRFSRNPHKPFVYLTGESSSSPKPATTSSSSSVPDSSTANLSSSSSLLLLPDVTTNNVELSSVSSDIDNLKETPFTTLAVINPQKYISCQSDVSSSSQELSTLSSYSSSQEFPSTSSCGSSQESSSFTYKRGVQDKSNEVSNSLHSFGTLNLSSVLKCEADSKLCLLCCANPANASIIHGKYAHQISCYPCAKKLKRDNKKCPVCRRTIDRVVHQITAL